MSAAPDYGPKPSFDAEFVGLLAEFLDSARKQKAMFDAYVEAGFTEDQALRIVIGMLVGYRSDDA